MKTAPSRLILFITCLFLTALVITACQEANHTADPTPPPAEAPSNVIIPDAPEVVAAGPEVKDTCAPCHQQVAAMIDDNAHAVHDCAQCHTPGDHATNPINIRPETNLTHELCGGCHIDQYRRAAPRGRHDQQVQAAQKSENGG